MGSVDKQLSGFGKSAGKIGGLLKGAFAGVAIVGGMKSMLSAASDLNETISKTKTIFGKSSPAIMAWANTAATSMGLSKQAALDGVSSFGNFFNQIGIGTKQSAAMSQSFVKMSSDLASFNNAAPTEVMEALSAATRGEYDSLQKFIPTINAAKVQQEALRESGKKSVAQLTDQDKALALHTLAVKGMGKAQGDFARTSGGLANQQRILKAKLDNVKASIGSALLPIATTFITFIVNKALPAFQQWGQVFQTKVLPVLKQVGSFLKANVLPALQTLGEFMLANKPVVATFAGVILTVVAALKVFAAVQALVNVVLSANPIGIVVIAIAALAAGLVYAYKKSDTFRAIVDGAFKGIKKVISAVMPVVVAIVKVAFAVIKAYVTTYARIISTVVKVAWRVISTATRVAWSLFKTLVINPVRAVYNFVKSSVSRVASAVSQAWNTVKSKTIAIWQGIKNAITTRINDFMNTIRGIHGKVTGAFSGAASWLYNVGKNIIIGLINGVKAMAGTVAKAASDVVGNAIDAAKHKLGVKSPSTVFKQIGIFTVQGLAKGLSNVSALNGVRIAASKMTTAIGSGFESPQLNLATAGGTGNVTYEITIKADATTDQVALGKNLMAAISAAEKAGARKRA